MRGKVCKQLRKIAKLEDCTKTDFTSGKMKVTNPHTLEQKAFKKIWNSQPRNERYIK